MKPANILRKKREMRSESTTPFTYIIKECSHVTALLEIVISDY